MKNSSTALLPLEKCPTGILGLDEITYGGLPKGRPTLVCGGPGCGKTLLALEFLYKGIDLYNEPGVFVSFEEGIDEIIKNVASLGFDLATLIKKKKMFLDYIHIDKMEIEETGEYDLEGIFVRLNYAIETTGAKRVVIDTIEALFAGLSNESIIRSELRRLFRWLKEKGVTAIITAEKGDGTLTRHGLEEYVSDCVIFLDQRIIEQVAVRRMRIIKYRGSSHGSNEYPFLIDQSGFSVFPVTSFGLKHKASNKRISSGIEELDRMLGGKGYYEGSSVMVSGTAGTGKSSIAAHFANSVCSRNEKVLYLAFEESPDQIVRNMKSIGIDLKKWIDKKFLKIDAIRATEHGLEMHLVSIHKDIIELKPRAVIIDPVTAFESVGNVKEIKSMLMRIVDMLKMQNITCIMLSLNHNEHEATTETEISSIIDTWILLRNAESAGEKNRCLYILKSRGMAHSNQVAEFLISSKGIDLIEPYISGGKIFTGSSKKQQEYIDSLENMMKEQELERRKFSLESKRKSLDSRIKALVAEFEAEEREYLFLTQQNMSFTRSTDLDKVVLAKKRGINFKSNGTKEK